MQERRESESESVSGDRLGFTVQNIEQEPERGRVFLLRIGVGVSVRESYILEGVNRSGSLF